MNDLEYINDQLLVKLNGVKNEVSDYLEVLKNRKTIVLNLTDQEDKSKVAMDFREWKIKNYKEMIKKSDDKLFSTKLDLVAQLEDLIKHLSSF
jgi:predicted glycosyltransferase